MNALGFEVLVAWGTLECWGIDVYLSGVVEQPQKRHRLRKAPLEERRVQPKADRQETGKTYPQRVHPVEVVRHSRFPPVHVLRGQG